MRICIGGKAMSFANMKKKKPNSAEKSNWKQRDENNYRNNGEPDNHEHGESPRLYSVDSVLRCYLDSAILDSAIYKTYTILVGNCLSTKTRKILFRLNKVPIF